MDVFEANEGINIVSNDQNGLAAREGGMNVMQGLLDPLLRS